MTNAVDKPISELQPGDVVLVERLTDLMSDISEDCWAAGWMSGIERDLWMLMNGTSTSNVWKLEERWVPRLIIYARALGEWPTPPDEGEGWVPLAFMEERFGPLPTP
jgi:hypothetical protein